MNPKNKKSRYEDTDEDLVDDAFVIDEEESSVGGGGGADAGHDTNNGDEDNAGTGGSSGGADPVDDGGDAAGDAAGDDASDVAGVASTNLGTNFRSGTPLTRSNAGNKPQVRSAKACTRSSALASTSAEVSDNQEIEISSAAKETEESLEEIANYISATKPKVF